MAAEGHLQASWDDLVTSVSLSLLDQGQCLSGVVTSSVRRWVWVYGGNLAENMSNSSALFVTPAYKSAIMYNKRHNSLKATF